VSETSFAWLDFDGDGDEERVHLELREASLKPAILVQTGTIPCSRFQSYFRLDHPMPAIDVEPINSALELWLGGDNVGNADRVMRLAGTLSWPSQDKANRGYLIERTALKLVPNAPRYSAEQLMRAAYANRAQNHANRAQNHANPAQNNANHAQTSANPAQTYAKGNGADRPSPYLAYAAETEHGKGRGMDEIQALLEASQTDHQWHNSMRNAVASMAGKGWTIEAMQMACGPYCDGGPHDRDLFPPAILARHVGVGSAPGTGTGMGDPRSGAIEPGRPVFGRRRHRQIDHRTDEGHRTLRVRGMDGLSAGSRWRLLPRRRG
jgi:hypothetical protein